MPEFDSTAIDRADYDARTQRLTVRFTNGRRYVYFHVPVRVYAGLIGADSQGVYFNAEIRDRYRFERLD